MLPGDDSLLEELTEIVEEIGNPTANALNWPCNVIFAGTSHAALTASSMRRAGANTAGRRFSGIGERDVADRVHEFDRAAGVTVAREGNAQLSAA